MVLPTSHKPSRLHRTAHTKRTHPNQTESADLCWYFGRLLFAGVVVIVVLVAAGVAVVFLPCLRSAWLREWSCDYIRSMWKRRVANYTILTRNLSIIYHRIRIKANLLPHIFASTIPACLGHFCCHHRTPKDAAGCRRFIPYVVRCFRSAAQLRCGCALFR